jgi:hypothetical protein
MKKSLQALTWTLLEPMQQYCSKLTPLSTEKDFLYPIMDVRSLVSFPTNFQVNCPNECSGHGNCINSKCVCDSGWNGTSCQQSYCNNNCSGQGTCVNNSCQCFPGSYGYDCSEGIFYVYFK